jgi:signal transduction histidine kinase
VPRIGLLHSVFGRVTLSAVAVSLLSTLLLFLVVQRIVSADGRAMLAREVDTDLAGLADVYLSSGADDLRARITDRLGVDRQDGERAYYLYADGKGRSIAGNLTRWPPIAPEVSEARFLRFPGAEPMFARATRLGPNAWLLVGRSYHRGSALQRRLAGAFAVTGAVIALLSLAAGHFAARRLRGRVEAVNGVFDQVRAGRITARAPTMADDDELSALASNTNAMLDQVEHLVNAQRAVSDQTAHEIRTPLLHLDSRILKAMDRTTDGDLQQMLAQSREEIRGVARLLDSLLDIAGTEALRGDPRGLSEVDLSEIANELTELYVASADDLGIRFRALIAPHIVARADAMQMMRLMSNLLDNAFRHAPLGGTVCLALSAGPRIRVEDDGPGIPRAERERVFERYVQLDQGEGRGHGLGLALARAIAGRHGLSIRIEDAGPGARFIVEPDGRDA